MYQNKSRNSKEELSRTRKPNSRYSDNGFVTHMLRPSYDKNYRNKHLWTVGYELQKGKCNLCNKKLVNGNMIVDHIVQKQYYTKYGENINKVQNFQVLCSTCNSIKTHQVDSKINSLIKVNDTRTRSYDVLRIYTMNLLRKIYREKEESLVKAKETINENNSNSSDDDSDEEEEEKKDEKSVEKVFSKLQDVQQSTNDSDSDSDSDLTNKSNNSSTKANIDEIDYDELPEPNSDSKSEPKEITRVIRTRSKSGSLPKKVENKLIITKSKQTQPIKKNNSVKRKIDYDSDNEEDEEEEKEVMVPKKIQKEETNQIISKKKDGKFISFIFKGCTFNNCTISL